MDLVHQLNEMHAQNLQKDSHLEARLQSFTRWRSRCRPEATDASTSVKNRHLVREAYGRTSKAINCSSRVGSSNAKVRFVQVWAGGWDHHQDIEDRLPERAKEIDQPLAAFIADLKQRNLFDETLVIWGGEFGRKPVKIKTATTIRAATIMRRRSPRSRRARA